MQTLDLTSNYLNNRSGFLTEQGQQSPNRCHFNSCRSSRMAESYGKGRLVFVFHVKIRRIDGERHDFSAIYNVSLVSRNVADAMDEGKIDFTLSDLLFRNSHIQKLVFVPVIEVLNEAEERRKESVWSVVRLYPLNACPHCLAQGLNSSTLVSESSRTIGDGKLKQSLVQGRVDSTFSDGNCINKLIESTPEIVNAIPNDQRPPIPIGKIEANLDAIAITLGVNVIGEDVGLSLFPIQDFVIDGFGVYLCTSDLKHTVG